MKNIHPAAQRALSMSPWDHPRAKRHAQIGRHTWKILGVVTIFVMLGSSPPNARADSTIPEAPNQTDTSIDQEALRHPIDLVFAINCMSGFWEVHQQEEGVQFTRTLARLVMNSPVHPDLRVGVILPNENGSGFDELPLTDDLDAADAKLISAQPPERMKSYGKIYIQYPLQYLPASDHHVQHHGRNNMGEWIGPAVKHATENMNWRSGENVLKVIYVLDANYRLEGPNNSILGKKKVQPLGTQYRGAVASAALQGVMVNVLFSSAMGVGSPANPFAPPTGGGVAQFMHDAVRMSGGYLFRVPRDTLPLGYAAKTYPNQDYDERLRFEEDLDIKFRQIRAGSSDEKERERELAWLRDYREAKQLSSIIYEIQKTYLPYGKLGELQTSWHVLQSINANLRGRSYAGSRIVDEALGQVDMSKWELVSAARLPNFDFNSIPEEDLPATMRGLLPTQRQALIIRMAQQREALQKGFFQLNTLNRWLQLREAWAKAPTDADD